MLVVVPPDGQEMKVVALEGDAFTPSCLARIPVSIYRQQPSQNALPWMLIKHEEKELICRAVPATNDDIEFIKAKSILWRPVQKNSKLTCFFPRLRIAESIEIDQELGAAELSELKGKLVHKPLCAGLFVQMSSHLVQITDVAASAKSLIKDDSCEFMLFAPQSKITCKQPVNTHQKREFKCPVGLEVPFRQLKDLVDPEILQKMRSIGLELPRGVLMSGPPGVGKTFLVQKIAQEASLPLIVVNGPKLIPGESEENLRRVFEEATEAAKGTDLKASILFFDEVDSIAKKREESPESHAELRLLTQLLTLMDGFEERKDAHVIILAATNRPDALDPAMRRPGRFDREILFEPPDAGIRAAILRELTPSAVQVDFDELGRACVGYVSADLVALSREAQNMAIKNDEILNMSHFKGALSLVGPSLHRQYSIALDKRVTWSSIGGIDEIRDDIRRFIEWPLLHPQHYSRMGLTAPKGVLLYGPPGCSKTTIAKAIANESGFTFYSLNGASLYSCYVGESEAQIREIFGNARLTAPSLIFFDEIDAIVGKRSSEFGQGGGDVVQERILSTLLNEMDGITSSQHNRRPVLVVGATNRKDLIDEALLRPGRFDRHIYIPKPSLKGRKQILELFLKGREVAADVDLDWLAGQTEDYSGADLKGLIQEAGLLAMHDSSFTFKAEHFSQILERPNRSRAN